MGEYILTYSKIKFYPLEPVKEDIKIEDIAHSLSLMTRANGHFKRFYSVAQHAVNCCREAKSRGYSERVQLGCLLHDSSESYISDLTRPVKKCLSEYFIIEERLQGIIYDWFGLGDLSEEEQGMIKDVDDALLYFEFEVLMDYKISDTVPEKTMEHDFSERDFVDVENEFLNEFNRLTGTKKRFSCVGVDGCKYGWVAVNIRDDIFEVGIYKNIEDICSRYGLSDSLIIDMPIGLPEYITDIRPDDMARKILSSRASCVFNVPCRQAVYESDYGKANEVNRKVLGKGLSRQSYAICSKIREIDMMLNKTPRFKNKILEGHPEVCFAMLNAGESAAQPIYESKRTEEGMKKRIQLLSRYYDKTDGLAKHMLDDSKLSKITDDVIDALCLAVTGMVGLNRGIRTIPEKPIKDSRGILMQIVYAR